MDLDLIERLMRLLETSGVTELDVSENGTRIRLSKATNSSVAQLVQPVAIAPTPSTAPETASGTHVIVAGLAGTFYRAPMPGEPPFVAVGDQVEDGRKLGLVEAMKMMNPVEADCSGRIVAIHLEDAMPVTAGMPLFTLEKAVGA